VYKRLKYGLFNPSSVVELKNDKKIYTIVFFFFMVLKSMIPAFLIINQVKNLDYDTKRHIRTTFQSSTVPYEIVNYELVKKDNSLDEAHTIAIAPSFHIVFNHTIETPPSILTDKNIILFTKNKVYHIQLYFTKELFAYEEYPELEFLDLSLADNDNREFWNTVFPVVNQQLGKYFYSIVITQLLFYNFLPIAFELFIFSLILAFFQKKFAGIHADIKFSKLWQLIIYILLPYVVLRLLSDLFFFPLLSFIGIIVTVIYSIRLNKGLVIRKDV